MTRSRSRDGRHRSSRIRRSRSRRSVSRRSRSSSRGYTPPPRSRCRNHSRSRSRSHGRHDDRHDRRNRGRSRSRYYSHRENGQVERYVRTVLNMLRIAVNHRKSEWAEELWQLQLILNLTKQKTTQTSALNLLIGHENATPVIRTLVRDVALSSESSNRQGRREMLRQRTAERLKKNQMNQDAVVNEGRRPPRKFQKDDLVFVIKYAQSQGKLDPGMRGPYRVVNTLRNDRYELKLMAGSYGKTTYAAAQYMVPWKGEWTPETCATFFEGTTDSDLDMEEAGPSLTPQPSPTITPARSLPRLISGSSEDDGPGEDTRVPGEAVLDD